MVRAVEGMGSSPSSSSSECELAFELKRGVGRRLAGESEREESIKVSIVYGGG